MVHTIDEIESVSGEFRDAIDTLQVELSQVEDDKYVETIKKTFDRVIWKISDIIIDPSVDKLEETSEEYRILNCMLHFYKNVAGILAMSCNENEKISSETRQDIDVCLREIAKKCTKEVVASIRIQKWREATTGEKTLETA